MRVEHFGVNMGVFIRQKKGHWYLDIVKNRKHHWRALHMKVAGTKAQREKQLKTIEELRIKIELEEFRGEFNLTDFDAKRQSFVEYATTIAQTSKSKSLIVLMIKFVRLYDKHNTSIGGIDVAFLEGFKKYLLERAGITQKSAHSYFAMLKLVMRRAVVDGIIMVNPCDKVKGIPDCEVEKDTLTAAELSMLFNTECKGKRGDVVKRAFLFACNTGLRYSDIVSLTWGDIENKDGEWTLHKRQVKTKKAVDSVLNDTAITLITSGAEKHTPSDFVFSELQDASRTATNFVIKDWVKAAGITKTVSWHTARRTFATLLLEAGADVFTTQRLMGHSKIQMTSVYAKSSSEVKARAVKALNALETGGEVKEG